MTVPAASAVAPRTADAAAALTFRRWRLEARAATEFEADADPEAEVEVGVDTGLGGRRFGAARAVPMQLLAPDVAVFDAWSGGAMAATQAHGCVRYATDGRWLHGCATIDEARCEGGLQAASRQAYADLFAVLAASASPHLLRLWNHFADMNLATGGIERYRQFNAGRQQAFTDAGRSAFVGAPAACALGTSGGPLQVYFLAGPQPPLAIENPRQVSAYDYPARYGARSPTFSRAALVAVGADRQALFISGTASIVGHETLHLGDVRRQTEESLANIAAVLGAAVVVDAAVVLDAATCAAAPWTLQALTCTVYIRHAADFAVVREVFERGVGARSAAARTAVYLRADICRADLLVEIEAHGFKPIGSPP